jgi:hypothetical protein
VLGIVIGAAAGSDRQRSPQRAAPAAPAVSPACKAAVDRANQSLAIAAQVEAALAEHTKIMNDLLHGKINGSTALKTGMPSLVTGASESARFDIALADYQQVVKRCQLR